jgi:hypothetical protein
VDDNKWPPDMPPPPVEEESKVIQLIPKKIVEEQKNITQMRDIFLRRQKCLFENTFAKGCKCNYCTFFSMMSQRVFEMIKYELNYQSKKGSMLFSSQDMISILQEACEKVIHYEKSQEYPPTPPKK